MKGIDKLGLVCLNAGKLLVARSIGKDTFYIPGGKREEGESDVEALTREVEEELSVEIDPETAKFVGVFDAPAHGKPESVVVQVTAYMAAFSGKLAPASEIEELAWLGYEDKNRCSLVTQKIMDSLFQVGKLKKTSADASSAAKP